MSQYEVESIVLGDLRYVVLSVVFVGLLMACHMGSVFLAATALLQIFLSFPFGKKNAESIFGSNKLRVSRSN